MIILLLHDKEAPHCEPVLVGNYFLMCNYVYQFHENVNMAMDKIIFETKCYCNYLGLAE